MLTEKAHMINAVERARVVLQRFATMALLHQINREDIDEANEALMGLAAVESVLLDIAESARWLCEGTRQC